MKPDSASLNIIRAGGKSTLSSNILPSTAAPHSVVHCPCHYWSDCIYSFAIQRTNQTTQVNYSFNQYRMELNLRLLVYFTKKVNQTWQMLNLVPPSLANLSPIGQRPVCFAHHQPNQQMRHRAHTIWLN